MPVFEPLRCILCKMVIRGSMFRCAHENCKAHGAKGFICQDCRYEGKHKQDHLIKLYKHCILRDVITPEISRKMCLCGTVPQYDADGRSRALFPVRASDKHRSTIKTGAVQCGLLDLGELIAEEKYRGIWLKMENRISLGDEKRKADRKKREQEAAAKKLENDRKKGTRTTVDRGKEATSTIQEKSADEDIPFFMRKFTDRYPFGNVHMALRVGPLLLENGVEQ
jgi:hypothetical protein